jgi:hypothetical protein
MIRKMLVDIFNPYHIRNKMKGSKEVRILLGLIALVFVAMMITATEARSGASLGVSIDDEGLREFHLAIGEYFHMPEREVIVVRERKMPDEELPVVFFLARKAHVEPKAIVDMRLGGKSWMQITLHYGLSPEIYYVALKEDPGPPYGKAYGYYKNKKRAEWGHIALADSDIINLVNLRFLSERYRRTPDEIVKLRGRGDTFVVITKEMKSGKHSSESERKQENHKKESKSKGKGKDK